MKTEQMHDFSKDNIKRSPEKRTEPIGPDRANSAVIKILRKRSADSLRTTRHTALSGNKAEGADGNEYHCKIDINRVQTVRLGKSEDSKSLIVSTNPKNREDYHNDPKTAINSEHNEISAAIGTARHQTAELKISRAEEEDFREFADKTATDKKITDYGGGIGSIFSKLGTASEVENLKTARDMRKNAGSAKEKEELLKTESQAETALQKREQLSLSIKSKTESVINSLEATPETDDNGFFDILLKRKRTPEEEEQTFEDGFDKFKKEENDEGNS